MSAALAGILGATVSAPSLVAFANEDAAKGHCMGANSCKGKGACMTEHNKCAGENACKGKAYLETTKAECEELGKKAKTQYKFDDEKKSGHHKG